MSLDSALPASATTRSSPAFARVRVFTDMREAQHDWAELERVAPHSAYQRRDWILPWLGSIGRAQGVTAAVTLALSENGTPLALLPLGVLRRGPLRLAEFLGGKDANFGLGLFRPGVRFTPQDLRALLKSAAAATPGGIDLFALVNQPHDWEGAPNPFVALARNVAPAEGYKASLSAPGEAFLKARLSADTRKKLRQKETKLAQLGEVRHIRASNAEDARRILSVFQAQKAQRMKNKGLDNVFEGPAAEEFLTRVAVEPLARGLTPAAELHALAVGERIVSTFAGAVSGKRFSGMFNSFDLSPEIARHSPGEILLTKIFREKCDEGLSTFDLGVGEARYKHTFCDQMEPLFDAYVPVTVGGRALMAVKGFKRDVKRSIKNDPRLWRLVEKARALRR